MFIFTKEMKHFQTITKNLLKLVQFSPIWTKLCQNVPNMISIFFSKPEGPRYPNKGVNEDFFKNKFKLFCIGPGPGPARPGPARPRT